MGMEQRARWAVQLAPTMKVVQVVQDPHPDHEMFTLDADGTHYCVDVFHFPETKRQPIVVANNGRWYPFGRTTTSPLTQDYVEEKLGVKGQDALNYTVLIARALGRTAYVREELL